MENEVSVYGEVTSGTTIESQQENQLSWLEICSIISFRLMPE
jgi:hypothetical protein